MEMKLLQVVNVLCLLGTVFCMRLRFNGYYGSFRAMDYDPRGKSELQSPESGVPVGSLKVKRGGDTKSMSTKAGSLEKGYDTMSRRYNESCHAECVTTRTARRRRKMRRKNRGPYKKQGKYRDIDELAEQLESIISEVVEAHLQTANSVKIVPTTEATIVVQEVKMKANISDIIKAFEAKNFTPPAKTSSYATVNPILMQNYTIRNFQNVSNLHKVPVMVNRANVNPGGLDNALANLDKKLKDMTLNVTYTNMVNFSGDINLFVSGTNESKKLISLAGLAGEDNSTSTSKPDKCGSTTCEEETSETTCIQTEKCPKSTTCSGPRSSENTATDNSASGTTTNTGTSGDTSTTENTAKVNTRSADTGSTSQSGTSVETSASTAQGSSTNSDKSSASSDSTSGTGTANTCTSSTTASTCSEETTEEECPLSTTTTTVATTKGCEKVITFKLGVSCCSDGINFDYDDDDKQVPTTPNCPTTICDHF